MTESCSWFKMEADYFFQSKSFFLFYNITMSGSLIFFHSLFSVQSQSFCVCSTQLIGSLPERVEETLSPPLRFYLEKFTSRKYTGPQGQVKEFTDLSSVLLHKVIEKRDCVCVYVSVCVSACL